MTASLDRRHLLGGLALAATPCAASTRAPGLAVTLDDFREFEDSPLDREQRTQRILDALQVHGVRAAGFPIGEAVDSDAGRRLLRTWASRGHLLGNHTYTHPFYPKAGFALFSSDVLRADALLGGLPGFRRLLRFPYLAEGATLQDRDAMRGFLKLHHYRNASVTIDTSDWYVDQRLRRRLKDDPKADLEPYRRYYLGHLSDRADYYNGLIVALTGRTADHTILLHHTLLNALFLKDALAMFRHKGWRLVDAGRAFAAPLFAQEPDALPAGQSLVWSLAKASGRYAGALRYPGEDDVYEKPLMDAAGL